MPDVIADTKSSFSESLIDLLLEVPAERITQGAVDAVLRCMEDTIGVAIAAVAARTAVAAARIAPPTTGDSGAAIWGHGRRSEAAAAALANGMLIAA